MTCKEAFAKALDEALSPSNDEHSSTPCKDAFAQALDELGYAADANPFKSAVGKIKGMFGKANQAAANKAASPAMQGPYAGFTPPGMTKTLAQHMEEGCEAQKPENCKYNKALADQIAKQEGIDPAQAMQKAIGIHNGGGGESQQARLGGAAATVEINFEDPKSTAQEIVKDPSKVDALPEGVPGEEKEIVTKAGEINVESATQEAVVRALNEKAMNGDADAQKALEGLKAIGEIGSQDNPDDAEPWIPPLPQEEEEKEDGEHQEEDPANHQENEQGPSQEENQETGANPENKGEEGAGSEESQTPSEGPEEHEKQESPSEEKPTAGSDNGNKVALKLPSGKTAYIPKEDHERMMNAFGQLRDWVESETAGRFSRHCQDVPAGSQNRQTLRNAIAGALMPKGEVVSDEEISQLNESFRNKLKAAIASGDIDGAQSLIKKHNSALEGIKDINNIAKEMSNPGNQKTTEGTIKPLEPKFSGEVISADMLEDSGEFESDKEFGESMANAIKEQLDVEGLGVDGISDVKVGPSSATIEFSVPASFDLAKAKSAKLIEKLGMAAGAKVTSVGSVDGKKNTIAVQISNPSMRKVNFSTVVKGKEWQEKAKGMGIPNALGKDANGNDIVRDMSKMPHTIITGATGSGKSVMLDTMIQSEKMAKTPRELRQIICDPKREFGKEKGSPYLYYPVASEVKDIAKEISSARKMMMERVKLLGVNVEEFDETKNEYEGDSDREIREYNKLHPDDPLPFVSIKVDEFAELMKDQEYGNQISEDLDSLLALGRSCGISLVLATQRSDVKSLPGRMQANAPGRITMKAAAGDAKGSKLAKSLQGDGDMIFNDGKNTVRGRGCFISKNDQKTINAYYRGETVNPDGSGKPSGTEGGKENPGGGTPTEPEKPAENGGNPEGGANPEEGGSEKPAETDPFDDLVSEESEKNFHAEQVQKQTAAAEEWRNQKHDEIENSNLSWDDRKKAVDAAKKEYAARLEAAKQGKAYEPPSEKPKEGEKGKEGEEPELTASQAEIKKEFDNEMQRELAAAEKLKLRDKINEKERIKAKYAKVDADIKNGKSMTEILDRIDKEEQEEADKKAAAEKAKADAEQAKTAKEKADKEKTAAEEAKKAEATKAKEKSKAEYTSLKDKALGDLKKQIGKNGYTEADYQKDKLALEEKHSKRLADLEAGKSEKDIYDRETAEQAEIDKRNEALKKTVERPKGGRKIPLEPKDEKEASQYIPKGWQLDGYKNGSGWIYASNPVNASYGFYNPKTKKFIKVADTSHKDYKGKNSQEAKKAREELKNAMNSDKPDSKKIAELEKKYYNIAYGHDEALPARAFLLSGIATYLATIR